MITRAEVVALIAAQRAITVGDDEIVIPVNLQGAVLRGVDLAGLNLARANLHGAELAGANLTGTNLKGANLHGANLGGAQLANADMGGANLHGACLCGALCYGTRWHANNLQEVCAAMAEGLPITQVACKPQDIPIHKGTISYSGGVATVYGFDRATNVTGMVLVHYTPAARAGLLANHQGANAKDKAVAAAALQADIAAAAAASAAKYKAAAIAMHKAWLADPSKCPAGIAPATLLARIAQLGG